MIRQYNRYGSILFLRTVIVYSFVLYLLISYFMVILPLPSIKEVGMSTSPWTQLIPFNFVSDIAKYSSFRISDISTYISALTEPVLYTNLFNLFLIIPFGFYLRYYFKRRWWEVILLSLILSLFFEITQLSGLYGIYPRPYRLFDVDDLIINTCGGLVGFFITPVLGKILPSRDDLDEISYEKGKSVSLARRILAFFLDIIIINIITLLLSTIVDFNIVSSFYPFFYLVYFLFITSFFNGFTIGKYLVKIKLVKKDGSKIGIINLLIRYFVLFIIFYQVYNIISWNKLFYIENFLVKCIINILYFLLFVVYLFTLVDIILKKDYLFYERLSNTKNISTIIKKRTESAKEKFEIVNKADNEKKKE